MSIKTISLSLVYANGGAVIDYSNLQFAFFATPLPVNFGAPEVTGNGVNITGGLFEITLHTALNVGDTGFLILTNTNGSSAQSPSAIVFAGPVLINNGDRMTTLARNAYSFASVAEFNSFGGAVVYGEGPLWIAGQQYWSNGSTYTPVGGAGITQYLPSGGNDTPGIVANFIENKGIAKLKHGEIYQINTPLLLEGGVKYINNYAITYAPQIVCDGIAILDTSGCDQNLLKVHDTYKIVGLTNASPCVVTLDATTPLPANGAAAVWVNGETRLIDGTRIYIQTPSSTQACLTWEAINGISSAGGATGYYIKTIPGSNTTFQLYLDAACTTPLDTTNTAIYPVATAITTNNVTEQGVTWNTAQAWKMRRYYGNYNYTPAVRLVGSVQSGTDRNNQQFANVDGVVIRNVANANYSSYMEFNGIGLAIENNLTAGAGGAGDTKTNQITTVNRVRCEGFVAAFEFDDSTNLQVTNVDFSLNYCGTFVGFNFDLVSYSDIRIGNERFVAGIPLCQGFMLAPVYYSPNNTYKPSFGQSNCLMLSNIWANGAHDILGDLNAKSVEIMGLYPERGRTVGVCGGGGNLSVHNCHFSTSAYGINLKNNETYFGAWANVHFYDNESDAPPTYGYVTTVHNSSNEQFCTRLQWENNDVEPSATGGHIKYNIFDATTTQSPAYITLLDDIDNGTETKKPGGSFKFHGATPMKGSEERWQRVAAATGTFDPIPEQYTSFDLTLTGALTIRNPCSRSDKTEANGRGFLEQHRSGAAKRLWKMLDLVFVLKQDATGGRVVTFNTAFNSTGLVNGSAATAGQISICIFTWSGAKWVLVSQTAWS